MHVHYIGYGMAFFTVIHGGNTAQARHVLFSVLHTLSFFNRTVTPTENKFVALVAVGEGWHNYHHIFPWDYKAAELGDYKLNVTTAFLDFMSWIGQASELKTVSKEMVAKRVQRTGDGTWKGSSSEYPSETKNSDHCHDNSVWGWGDKDMKETDLKDIATYNNLKEL